MLETVAARLAHAMHESHGPVDRMGAALERMMRALALDDPEQCREALEREIAVCIESLQFHDRLMQHLAHVRGGLAALAGKSHAGGVEIRKPDLGAGSVELF